MSRAGGTIWGEYAAPTPRVHNLTDVVDGSAKAFTMKRLNSCKNNGLDAS